MKPENGSRLPPQERKQQILEFATELAEEIGYRNITSSQISRNIGLKSHSLVAHYFGSIEQLREIVLEKAIENKNLEIILQGLVTKDPRTARISYRLKKQALSLLTNE